MVARDTGYSVWLTRGLPSDLLRTAWGGHTREVDRIRLLKALMYPYATRRLLTPNGRRVPIAG